MTKSKKSSNAPPAKKGRPVKSAATATSAAPATTPATATSSPFTRDARLPAIGTVLQRAYKKKVHEVTVREDGFLYEGETYRSLSALARKISGAASVNGFLWFGLTGRKPVEPSKPTKGTPEQVASVAKARAARAAKVAARRAAKSSS